MFVGIILNVIGLALCISPGKAPAPPAQLVSPAQLGLPTPDQMLQNITTVLLECNRRELAGTIRMRERLEQESPRTKAHEDLIAKLKAWEESYRKRIEQLEGGTLSPPVRVMPLERPRTLPPTPKPPVRD